MWQNFIGKQIARANRNLLLTCLVVLLCCGGLAALSYQHTYNMLKGPAPIAENALAAIKSPDSVYRNYVTVRGDDVFDTGVTQVEQEKDEGSNEVKSEHTTAGFVLLRVGTHVLLVKETDQPASKVFNGEITAIPEDVRGEVVTPLQAANKDAAAALLPFMVDASSHVQDEYGFLGYGFLVGLIVAAVACVFGIFLSRYRESSYDRHPIARRLASYGTPYQVADEIDNEVRQTAQSVGKMTLTKTWLLRPTAYGMNAIRLSDIVWAYQKTTQHRVYLVIPTRKTFAAIVCEKSGKKTTMQVSQTGVQALLAEIAA